MPAELRDVTLWLFYIHAENEPRECDACEGEGYSVNDERCSACDGSGRLGREGAVPEIEVRGISEGLETKRWFWKPSSGPGSHESWWAAGKHYRKCYPTEAECLAAAREALG